MTARPGPSRELLLAVLLLISSGAGVLWVQHEIAAVDVGTELRRERLEQLHVVERSAVAAGAPCRADLGFGDLFTGHELVWTTAPGGGYMTLVPCTPGLR